MTMLILQHPNPILSEKIEPIEGISIDLIEAISTCASYLTNDSEAVGVAANQLGFKHRFFLYKWNGKINLVINPEILAQSSELESGFEGCLSFLDEQTQTPRHFIVNRPKHITVRYGLSYPVTVKHERTLIGYERSIFCHEIDHLDGLTVLDRA